MGSMTFVYATDHNFVDILLVSMYSLLDRHVEDALTIYIIIDNDVDDGDQIRIKELADHFGKQVVLLNMPDLCRLTDAQLDVGRYAMSMFSRLCVGSLLPDSVKRIVYLDCDTLIMDTLRPLWGWDLKGAVMGAVNDSRSRLYGRNIGIRKENCYINSGVLLIDVERYRQRNCERRLLNRLAELNGRLEFPDNDVLCTEMQDEILLLPMRYNMISPYSMCSWSELMELRHPQHPIPKSEYEEEQKKIAILHFTTFVLLKGRPWMEGCDHKYAELYRRIWKSVTGKPLRKMSVPTRGRWLAAQLQKVLPRFICVAGLGVVHAYIKPILQSVKLCRKRKMA